jgi:hypothetical protein
MTCNEIENRLPAYLEGLLSPEERKSIAGHLASCPRCSRAFADLMKAEQIVHGLGEVEPPPFFEQRIMSRIREEAGRKQGFLRKLFYPLHIKIPIQALATILVAVLAFHVYQTGEPEMKQYAPLPIPLTEPGKGRVAAAPPQTPVSPSTAALVKRAPAGDLSEKNRQQFAALPPENGGKAERATDSPASMREAHPAAMKPAATVMEVNKRDVPQISAEASGAAQDRTGKQDAGRAPETLLPEQKQKEKMADTGATAGAAMGRSVMDLTIQVGDTAVAIREIEAHLGQFNARIIEKERRSGGEFLKAEIAARNVAALLDMLQTIGKVNLDAKPLAVPDENVVVGIKIVAPPGTR